MGATTELAVIEQCRISPPPATIGQRSMPLTFFDITWLNLPPIHQIFFYDFPYSKSHFVENVVPNFKRSLSLALRHFFPFVSNLIVFPEPDNFGSIKVPEIRHVEGDYVALTIAESTADFVDLTGNHPRNCEKFYLLLPQLSNTVKVHDYACISLFSVQITVFPNLGISIGLTNHHSLGDATTTFNFLKVWASIDKFGGDQFNFLNESPPIYERLINLPNLEQNRLRESSLNTFYQTPSLVDSRNNVRATFILTRININELKRRAVTQLPKFEHVSSHTVTCGYIWSCIVKSSAIIGEKGDEDDLQQFISPVDCRSRLDPPLSSAYFGNYLAPSIATAKSVVLKGQNGFVTAAKLIGEGIHKLVKGKGGILKDAEKWNDGFKIPAKTIGVSGTPKLEFYALDFGWGKPKKCETISIDYNGSISIYCCKESTQDYEIGLCLPSMQMEAFANVFNGGLDS